MFMGGHSATVGGIGTSSRASDVAVDVRPDLPSGSQANGPAVDSADDLQYFAGRVLRPAQLVEHGPVESGSAAPDQDNAELHNVNSAGSGWRRRYCASLVVIDLLAAFCAVGVGFIIRFGWASGDPQNNINFLFGAVLPVFWVGTLAFNRSYEGRFVGVGTAEFERVFRSFLHLTVLTAFIAFATHTSLARGFVLVVLPLTLALDLAGRYGARKRLHRRRATGESMTSVLTIGGVESVEAFTASLERDRYAGMQVTGACLPLQAAADPDADRRLSDIGVRLLGDVDSVRDSARLCGADTVAVLSGEISAEKLRWISWQLEGTDIDLVVSPGLIEVGGRRLHVQPVAGLPMLHVDEPEFAGVRRVAKAAFDRGVAAVAVLILSPLLFTVAVAVKLGSPGRVLFRQERIGLGGKAFTALKFRSMCVDAEERLADLRESNENDGVLFKIKNDPRITKVGRVIRKYSLDELPQLINVVKGDMSLVGPRPPLRAEVVQYGDDVRRRLLVKPGITGLWQISGRSDLSWEESVRLDLRYVENWSFATDLMILWKTIFAVVRSSGAY